MKTPLSRPSHLFAKFFLLGVGLLGLGRSATADVISKFVLVGVHYGASTLDGTFTYDFTTNHWVTCSFLNGAINGNPLVSPVNITTSSISGDYSTQTWSYSFEFLLVNAITPTSGANVAVDPPGTPPNQLTSFFTTDDGLGNPNSVTIYPITGGAVVYVAPGNPLCYGDGSQATACPCGNTGSIGHGCDNSSGTGGAVLSATGVAALSLDVLQLTSSGEKPSASSVFLQGSTSNANGSVFGQGVLCAGGTLKRLYVKNAAAGVVVAPIGADLPVHARSAALGDTIAPGSTRYYQTYYRDPTVLGGCSSGSTFNVSQALSVVWSG
jgi:hypothetical protein